MNVRTVMWLLSVGIVLAGLPFTAAASGHSALEKRLTLFCQQLRCLVCQNETLADSQADLAVDLRREIGAQMEQGRSDDEILAFLTERYGDFVRYRPALKPSTYALWFGPFVLLAGGLTALHRGLKRRATRSQPARSRAIRRRSRPAFGGRVGARSPDSI